MAPADNIDLSNERLVAYIDGEVSASERDLMDRALQHDVKARERLDILSRGGRPFSEAFGLLLDAAPEDRLQAMFADIAGRGASPSSQPRPMAGSADNTVIPMRPRREARSGFALWQMVAAAAILALVFAGGLFAGGLFEAPQQQVAEKVGWREAAARYVSLFSKETLEGMPTDPQQRQANLKQIETSLGLSLSGERIASASLSFEGSQLLQIEGKPLAQIAYLRDGTPVALCITRTAMPTAGPATEQRYGLNVVHWVANGYGFMVLGKVPESDLARIAADFRSRFS